MSILNRESSRVVLKLCSILWSLIGKKRARARNDGWSASRNLKIGYIKAISNEDIWSK